MKNKLIQMGYLLPKPLKININLNLNLPLAEDLNLKSTKLKHEYAYEYHEPGPLSGMTLLTRDPMYHYFLPGELLGTDHHTEAEQKHHPMHISPYHTEIAINQIGRRMKPNPDPKGDAEHKRPIHYGDGLLFHEGITEIIHDKTE